MFFWGKMMSLDPCHSSQLSSEFCCVGINSAQLWPQAGVAQCPLPGDKWQGPEERPGRLRLEFGENFMKWASRVQRSYPAHPNPHSLNANPSSGSPPGLWNCTAPLPGQQIHLIPKFPWRLFWTCGRRNLDSCTALYKETEFLELQYRNVYTTLKRFFPLISSNCILYFLKKGVPALGAAAELLFLWA